MNAHILLLWRILLYWKINQFDQKKKIPSEQLVSITTKNAEGERGGGVCVWGGVQERENCLFDNFQK